MRVEKERVKGVRVFLIAISPICATQEKERSRLFLLGHGLAFARIRMAVFIVLGSYNIP